MDTIHVEDDDITQLWQPDELVTWQVRQPNGTIVVLSSRELEEQLRASGLPISVFIAEDDSGNWRRASEVPRFARAARAGTPNSSAARRGAMFPPPPLQRMDSQAPRPFRYDASVPPPPPMPAGWGTTVRPGRRAEPPPLPFGWPERTPRVMSGYPRAALYEEEATPHVAYNSPSSLSPAVAERPASVVVNEHSTALVPVGQPRVWVHNARPVPPPPRKRTLVQLLTLAATIFGSGVLVVMIVQLILLRGDFEATSSRILGAAARLSDVTLTTAEPQPEPSVSPGAVEATTAAVAANAAASSAKPEVGTEPRPDDAAKQLEMSAPTSKASAEETTGEQSSDTEDSVKANVATTATAEPAQASGDEADEKSASLQKTTKTSVAKKARVTRTRAKSKRPTRRATRATRATSKPAAVAETSETKAKDDEAEPATQEKAVSDAKEKSESTPSRVTPRAPEPAEPFNTRAASTALARAASAAKVCGGDGQAQLRILFTNLGAVQRVDVLEAPPGVSNCLVQRFQNLRIPAYGGKQRAVTKSLRL